MSVQWAVKAPPLHEALQRGVFVAEGPASTAFSGGTVMAIVTGIVIGAGLILSLVLYRRHFADEAEKAAIQKKRKAQARAQALHVPQHQSHSQSHPPPLQPQPSHTELRQQQSVQSESRDAMLQRLLEDDDL